MGLLVSIGHVTTTRTRVPYVVATIGNHLWLGQVGNRGHPFSGIGSLRTRTKHGFALLVLMLEPQGYDKGSSGAILKPGKDAIVSAVAPTEASWGALTVLSSACRRYGAPAPRIAES